MEYVSRNSLHVDTQLLFSNARLDLNNRCTKTSSGLRNKDDITSTFRILHFSRKYNTLLSYKI